MNEQPRDTIGGLAGLMYLVILLLVTLFLLSGCAFLDRASIENQRRIAVIHLIEAEANVLEAGVTSLVRFKQTPVWPATWPVTIEVTYKKGEPETNFVRLPSLSQMLIP